MSVYTVFTERFGHEFRVKFTLGFGHHIRLIVDAALDISVDTEQTLL